MNVDITYPNFHDAFSGYRPAPTKIFASKTSINEVQVYMLKNLISSVNMWTTLNLLWSILSKKKYTVLYIIPIFYIKLYMIIDKVNWELYFLQENFS